MAADCAGAGAGGADDAGVGRVQTVSVAAGYAVISAVTRLSHVGVIRFSVGLGVECAVCAVHHAILCADPGIEEVTRVVCAIFPRVSLVVGCGLETLSGTECHVESRAGFEFGSDVSARIWRIDGAVECDWSAET